MQPQIVQDGNAIACPYCGAQNATNARYCSHCMKVFSNNNFNAIQATGFRCPFCHSDKGYYLTSHTSSAGIIIAILLLLICFPLFWIGFLMKEEQRFCSNCRMKLG